MVLAGLFAMCQGSGMADMKWIACSERMPEVLHTEENDGCSEWLIVYAPSRGRDAAFWDGQHWYWSSGGYAITSEVTHWVPMPALPEAT